MIEIDLSRDYWITKDGRQLEFSEMEDEHLLRVLVLLQKQSVSFKEQQDALKVLNVRPMSEAAEIAFQHECDSFWSIDAIAWMKRQPTYQGLIQEAKRRNLTIPKAWGTHQVA